MPNNVRNIECGHGLTIASLPAHFDNRLILTQPRNAPGCFELVGRTGSVFVQTDFDYPGIAANFGFVPCEHCNATDGTVDCPHNTASEMISRAYDFLVEHIGETCDDPGYLTD